jgi:DNA-binding response OmpR family regulator
MTTTLPTILIVEDDPGVTQLLAYNLRRDHYQVLTAADGAQALDMARTHPPDLILLDLMLPLVDGWAVCRELRRTSNVPIIMVSARDEEIDRVVGLELGADDYICKPFGLREILARIKAVLRRAHPIAPADPAQPLTGPGGLLVDPASREARAGDTPIELTRLEFDLLYTLMLNAGRVLSRERLLELVWGYDFAGDDRTVDSAIKRLRAALRAATRDANRQPDGIVAVRGVGYKFVGDKG